MRRLARRVTSREGGGEEVWDEEWDDEVWDEEWDRTREDWDPEDAEASLPS